MHGELDFGSTTVSIHNQKYGILSFGEMRENTSDGVSNSTMYCGPLTCELVGSERSKVPHLIPISIIFRYILKAHYVSRLQAMNMVYTHSCCGQLGYASRLAAESELGPITKLKRRC